MNFMPVPQGKHFGAYDDHTLMRFLLNDKNNALKSLFEQAAGVTLGQHGMASIGIIGDNPRDVALAKDGLGDLAREMRTIREDQFARITSKVAMIRG